jgi:hypothetical protein
MKFILILLSNLLILNQCLAAGESNPIDVSISNWKSEEIVTGLIDGDVESIITMAEHLGKSSEDAQFTNEVFFVTLKNGIQGVFKPQSGNSLDHFGEVAAYKLSCKLGFSNVPPTVMRKIGEKDGSLQLYVKPNYDLLGKNKGEFDKMWGNNNPEEVQNLKIFYYVFGQWDNGPHNMLMIDDAGEKKLIAIDN